MPNDTTPLAPPQEPTNDTNTGKVDPAIGGDTEEQLIFMLQDIEDKLDQMGQRLDKLEAESKGHASNIEASKQETDGKIKSATDNMGAALKQHVSNLLQ